MTTRLLAASAALAAGALALAGCSAQTPAAQGSPGPDLVDVVAVTDVYGSVAEAIGGDRVAVTSVVTGAGQDPHSYEASTRDQLAVAEADVVIVNGGGYDDFMSTLIDASGTSAIVVSAVEASGLLGEDHEAGEHAHEHAEDEHDHSAESGAAHEDEHGHAHIEGFNEHVWYSVHAMEHIADAIEAALAEADPAGASVFESNAAAFLDELDGLHERIHELGETAAGRPVVVTEPVPLYLLDDLGFEDVTPEGFSEAIEEGGEISVSLLDAVLTVVRDGGIAIVASNTQTAGPETERVIEAAEAAGVPVLSFLETLPDGEDYLSWMASNVAAVERAIA